MAEPLSAPMPPRVRAWCMAAAGACLLPLLMQLPAGLGLGLGVLALAGGLASRSWPVFLRLVLLALGSAYVVVSFNFSIGRDSGIAMLALLLALKPMETQRLRDGRSLLGFSLFAPFAAFLQDQGPLVMLLSVPAMALQLVALSVLAEQRPGVAPPRVDRARLRAVGAAVVMGLPLALAGFWLFPRLPSPLWGLPENAQGRGGLGERMTPDQWVEMFADDGPALRVRFSGAAPAPADMYWRGQVLWSFDGRSWSRGFLGAGRSAPSLSSPQRALDYEVSLEPTDRRYLVTLDHPMAAPAPGQLTSDLTVVANEPVSSLLKYEARSLPSAIVLQELSPAERVGALALPADLNPRTRALAAQWRAEIGNDDAAIVRRALEWIAADFSYSLSVPPSGRDAVDDFLFETQLGFCQHFSSAFAVLMRAAGVPSRVVLGYSGGSRNRYGDYWVVRRLDAHAWNEVWLAGRGWVRVDPTAAVAPERVLDTVEDLAREESVLPDSFGPLLDLGDWARRGWNELVLGFNATRQASLLRPFGIDQASGTQLGVAFALGAGLALGLTLWVLMRGRPGPRDPLLSAWFAFTRRLARAGLGKAPSEPPLSFGRRLAARLPGQAEALESLSRRYAAWRYAPADITAAEKARLIAELRAFRPDPTTR